MEERTLLHLADWNCTNTHAGTMPAVKLQAYALLHRLQTPFEPTVRLQPALDESVVRWHVAVYYAPVYRVLLKGINLLHLQDGLLYIIQHIVRGEDSNMPTQRPGMQGTCC